jgi:hypothetical protein
MGSAYSIQLVGETTLENAPLPNALETAIAAFTESGYLLVESAIPTVSTNDVNSLDFLLSVGDVFDEDVAAGELQFASNTALYSYLGQEAADPTDIVTQTVDPVTGDVSASVDAAASLSDLEVFNPGMENQSLSSQSSDASPEMDIDPVQISLGSIDFGFSPDFQQVQGTVTFTGSGADGSLYRYSTAFSGDLVSQYTGLAEGDVGVS